MVGLVKFFFKQAFMLFLSCVFRDFFRMKNIIIYSYNLTFKFVFRYSFKSFLFCGFNFLDCIKHL